MKVLLSDPWLIVIFVGNNNPKPQVCMCVIYSVLGFGAHIFLKDLAGELEYLLVVPDFAHVEVHGVLFFQFHLYYKVRYKLRF